ncbi:LysE family translocator [Streptomyces vietnamensis]|uniref:LysE family translocator n=1 Tax=Streptomyces vietnamensis TaxID=362257 RepID=UPI003429927C
METGTLLHVIAAVCGLATLIAGHPFALAVLRHAGAGYLTHLGIRGLRRRRPSSVEPADTTGRPARRRLLRLSLDAVLVNLLNPEVVLFFLAFLPQFLPTGPTSTEGGSACSSSAPSSWPSPSPWTPATHSPAPHSPADSVEPPPRPRSVLPHRWHPPRFGSPGVRLKPARTGMRRPRKSPGPDKNKPPPPGRGRCRGRVPGRRPQHRRSRDPQGHRQLPSRVGSCAHGGRPTRQRPGEEPSGALRTPGP